MLRIQWHTTDITVTLAVYAMQATMDHPRQGDHHALLARQAPFKTKIQTARSAKVSVSVEPFSFFVCMFVGGGGACVHVRVCVYS